MRVLHIIASIDTRQGGPQAVLTGLATEERGVGLEVSVAYTWRPEDKRLEHTLAMAGVNVTAMARFMVHSLDIAVLCPSSGDLLARRTSFTYTLFRKDEHQAARACQQEMVPYVITPHGMLDPWSLAQSRWKKRIYIAWRLRHDLRHAAAIHCTSNIERHRQLTPFAFGTHERLSSRGLELEDFHTLPRTASSAHDMGFHLPSD